MSSVYRFLPWLFLIGIALAALGLVLRPAPGEAPAWLNEEGFERVLLADIYDIADLGATDINADQFLDIYTTNHNAAGYIVLNRGDGTFTTDVSSDLGLSGDHPFPGLSRYSRPPEHGRDGLYIYYSKSALVFEVRGREPVDYRLSVTTPLAASTSVDGKVQVLDAGSGVEVSPPLAHTMRLEFSGSGRVAVSTRPRPMLGVPYTIMLDDGLLQHVFIGEARSTPEQNEFKLMLRDRHAAIWADFNADGYLDVFINRGAMRGRLQELAPGTNDEFYVGGIDGFSDYTAQSGLRKRGCPGRQSAWLDYEGDGDLDMYIVCGRNSGDGSMSRNRLLEQVRTGQWRDTAATRGIDLAGTGSFAWMDVDNDGDQDLFWASVGKILLYRNEGSSHVEEILWQREQVKREDVQLSLADFDSNGFMDVFASSSQGNVLFENRQGKLHASSPGKYGLPESSVVAHWVDYDNDGLMDLHALPDGIFRQRDDGRFLLSPGTHVELERKIRTAHARVTWADIDNDGRRDALIAVRFGVPSHWYTSLLGSGEDEPVWQLELYGNRSNHGNWLQLELTAAGNNPQAVGTRVVVTANDSRTAYRVGQSEGAYLSQGHYRLYIGLGSNEHVESIDIRWPDGQQEILENVQANQLLRVSQINY